MSTTIDQKVVEMRFDNKQFEQATRTSMSTLDKLKQSLNLNGAAKGLESINSAAKNVNLSSISSSAETVSAKFSAMQVMGVTALVNLTNAAMNAGTRMVKALTLDPVISGFQEYETQINAVQTILANTRSKGSTIDDVNKALDELNKYADLTIYNFTEMTRNIGTFTAAGIDLETSVNAIQGIANLAAVSGSTSQQASTAMYQLSQALAAGTVKLMDWNSVVNAGMGGEVFQNALKKTSELLGTGAEAAIKAEGSFRESLKKGWLTSEVLTETLKKFTTSGANEYVAEYTGLSQEAVQAALDEAEARYGEADAIEYASKALAEKSGKNKDEIKEALEMAKTAQDAATKVKTFSQLWDVMKEAAQSGWSKTWQLIIGDFEEAKNLLTPIADFVTSVIGKMSDARNLVLESALGKSFTGLAEKVKGAITPIQKSADSIKEVVKSVKQYSEVVDQILGGKWGNGQERWNKLSEAGYDWAHAQNLVNEKLGSGVRHATEYKEAQEGVVDAENESISTKGKLSEEEKNQIKRIVSMTEEQAKAAGYTDKQIKAFKELGDTAEKLGIPLDEFIDNLDEINGRWLLINSFKNIGKGLISVIKAIGDAWKQAFYGNASDEEIIEKRAEKLFNIVAVFHKLTAVFSKVQNYSDQLTRTFKGLFAVLDIISTITGGALKVGLKVLCKVLGMADIPILDITAHIGDMLVAFRDWLFETGFIAKSVKYLVDVLSSAIDKIREWIKAFMELPQVQNGIEKLKNSLSNFKEIGKNIVEGLKEGIKDGITSIPKAMIELGKKIIEAIKGVLGIHSPSTVMIVVGTMIVAGIIVGILNAFPMIGEAIKKFGSYIAQGFENVDWSSPIEGAKNGVGKIAEAISNTFSNIDWEKVFAVGISIGSLAILKKFADALSVLASPLEGAGDALSGLGNFLNSAAKGIKKSLGALSNALDSVAIKNIAISLAILLGALALLTFLDMDKLQEAVKIVAQMALILGGLIAVVEGLSILSAKFGSGTINFGKLTLGLIGISSSIVLIAIAAKKVGTMNPDQTKQAFLGLAGIVAAIGTVLAAYGLLVRGESAKSIDRMGKMMIKLSIAMGLMVIVIKLVSGLSPEQVKKGAAAIAAFVGIVALLSLVTQNSSMWSNELGKMLLKMSASMILMVAVIKLISGLSIEELTKGGAVILAFVGIIALLGLIARAGGLITAGLGRTLLAMSASMLIMILVVKLIASMSPSDLVKGGLAILAFVGIIALLTLVVKMAGPQTAKIGATILALSVSIGILAVVAVMLSLIDLKGLAKGIVAVGMLSSFMALMIVATRGASDCKGNLIVMTVAIGIMAAAIAVLSMIDGSRLAGATAALGTLMAMFALIAKAAGGMNKIMGNLIIMTLAVGALAGIIYLLAGLSVDYVLGVSASLSILLLSLAASMKIIDSCGAIAPTALVAIGIMTLVVGGLALIIRSLSECNPEQSIGIVASLSAMLLSMTAVIGVLSLIGPAAAGALTGIGVMAAMVLALGGLMAGLGALVTYFPSMEEFLNKGITILEKIGYGLGSFFGNIIGGFSEGVTSGLPGVGENLSSFMENLSGFVEGAKAIDETALTGVSNLAKMFALLAGGSILESIASWVTGESSMDVFGAQLKAFGDAMVSFSNKVSGNIDEGAVTAAANVGLLLSELQNSIRPTGGVMQFFSGEKDLATFSAQLIAFGDAIVKFSSKVAGNIDEGAVTAAASAGNIMAELQSKVAPSGGVLQFFAGQKNLEEFGTQLVSFGGAILEFSSKISEGTIDESTVAAVGSVGTIMAELQSKVVPSGGVLQFFTGQKDLSTFGTQLIAFGDAIVKFSSTVGAEGAINETAITAAASAGGVLAELQSKIEPMGGVIDFFTGRDDLATFGTQIASFGEAISSFSKSVTGENSIDQAAVSAAANAGLIMAELQKAIPEDKWLDGKVTIDEFGSQIKAFGEGLSGYSEKVSDINIEAISSSLSQARSLVSLTKSISNLDTEGIDTFKEVKGIGSAIKGYADKVADIDPSLVSSSIGSASRLINLIRSLSGLDPSGIENFKISSIGSKMKSYYESVSGIDPGIVSSSITSAMRLVAFINSTAGMDSSGVGSFVTAINTLGQASVDKFVSAFTNAGSKLSTAGSNMIISLVGGITSKQSTLISTTSNLVTLMQKTIQSKVSLFRTAGVTLIAKLSEGMSSQKTKAKNALTSILSDVVNAIKDYHDDFYNAGNYLVEGFADGISENTFKAEAKARAMARAALEAAEEELDENSPSKEFYRVGDFAGQGFVNALGEYERTSYKAGSEMANSAKTGLTNAISKIKDMLSGDIDTAPTIRPVLDLTNVKEGADSISGMFGINPSVALLSNVGSISSTFNRNSQNGANYEVVSAINKLRKELGNVGNTNYNINGITYDDGSNVSDAIKSLIRAAKVERRV